MTILRRSVSVLVGLLVLSLAADGAPAPPAADPVSVAVVEFETRAADAGLGWVGRTFSTSLTTALARSDGYRLVERQFLARILDELELQASGRVDPATAATAGRLLGARLMVVGAAELQGATVRATARVVDVESSVIMGSVEETGDLRDLFALQREFGEEVSALLRPLAVVTAAGPSVEMSTEVLKALDELERIGALLPRVGRDPLRRRRAAELLLAQREAGEIVRAHPRLARAHFYRALFALNTDDLPTALEAAAVAVELEPVSIEYRLLQANVLLESGRGEAGAEVLNRLLTDAPYSGIGWYALGRQRLRSGDEPAAIVAFLRSLEGTEYVPEAETNLRTLLGSPAGESRLAHVDRVDPSYGPAAELLWRYWTDRPARDLAQRVATRNDQLYIAHLVLGRALRESRDLTRSEAALRRALELEPEVPAVHRSLALTLAVKGACADAHRHARIYLTTASYVGDYDQLEESLEDCR